MVDLDGVRGFGAAREGDRLAGVGVVQHAALRVAGARAHDQFGEVPAQDVVAGVAAVVAELDVDVVTPRLTEPVAGEVGVAVPALDRQPVQRLASGVICGALGGGRRLATPAAAAMAARAASWKCSQTRHGDSKHQQPQQHGNDTAHIAVLALEPVEC